MAGRSVLSQASPYGKVELYAKTYLPTKKTPARQRARFFKAHGHQSRAHCAVAPPREGPPASYGLGRQEFPVSRYTFEIAGGR